MGDSSKKICVLGERFATQFTRPKELSMAVGRGVYTISLECPQEILKNFKGWVSFRNYKESVQKIADISGRL
jgi:hypothetical protein